MPACQMFHVASACFINGMGAPKKPEGIDSMPAALRVTAAPMMAVKVACYLLHSNGDAGMYVLIFDFALVASRNCRHKPGNSNVKRYMVRR